MPAPKRIQLSRKAGWRLPAGARSVARPTRWGNPWTVAGARGAGFEGTDADLAALVVGFFRNGMRVRARVCERIHADLAELRGRDLACWCSLDQLCHADVLLELANK